MYTRPNKKETDEDLFRLQEEYYNNIAKNVVNPAATFVKANYVKKEPIEDPKQVESVPNINIVPKHVMGGIVEKNDSFNLASVSNITKHNKGFPKATKRQLTGQREKKCSIFASEMARKHKNNVSAPTAMPINVNSSPNISKDLKNLPMVKDSKSFIISGPESDVIHQENVELINRMSTEEILLEKQKLLESMDPKLIDYIKSKRKKENVSIENTEEKITVSESNSDIKFNIDILSHPESNKWLHFDKVEIEKFEWMKNIDYSCPDKSNEQYEARFDFHGYLLPYMKEITEETRALYHHGDEPARPGYTLQELLQLCRSSFPQQSIVAHNTIANILTLYNTGVYDGIIELPIEQIFFVTRFSLDENVIPIMTASLKAMHNIFVNQIDEVCLDGLLSFNCGLVQPILDVKQNETNNDNNKVKDEDLNDQQMAEINMVKCLLRTNILVRIRYIFNTLQPPTETIVLCLELLIRLSRDKQAIKVYNCENLIEIIISNFIPPTNLNTYKNVEYKKPMASALKLIRVLMCRSKHITTEIVQKYQILNTLLNYLSSDAITSDVVKIQIEAMYIFSIVLHYRIHINIFLDLQQILLRILNFHNHSTNISNSSYNVQAHFAAAICTITEIAKISNHAILEPFIPLLHDGLLKCNGQILRLNNVKCGDLQIISSMYKCWSEIQTAQFPHEVVNTLLKSTIFDIITQRMKSSSNLLCHSPAHENGAAFDSVKASIWNAFYHITPILHPSSCMPFLSTFTSYLLAEKNEQNITTFMNIKNIKKYFKSLISNSLHLINNWFTRIEAKFIINCLKMAVIINKKLNDVEKYQIYNITVKCIHIFRFEMQNDVLDILNEIIFNKNFFLTTVVSEKLELTDNLLRESLENIDEIIKTYILELRLNMVLCNTNIVVNNNDESILPNDWIYLPIINLYTNNQNNSKYQSSNIEEERLIMNCLQWVSIYETIFPDLIKSMNITDRFCRLCCVFMCSNSVFLEKKIQNLINICVQNIIKEDYLKILNFDSEIQGLNNFQDFYTVLLEQYQAVSYGDTLFSNIIMIPLAQTFNVKWRKILWSEYAAVTQSIKLTEEELIVPLQSFLYPIETDISVLRCYRRTLANGCLKRSPVLIKIAEHHISEYKKNIKNGT